MPAFSATSRSRLATCHADLQTIFNEVIKVAECTIVCGHRTQAEQAKAFASKLSQVEWPNSKHNSMPSMAVDVAPYVVEIRNIDWDDIKSFCVLKGMVDIIAKQLLDEGRITHRLRWGGDWDGDGRTVDQKFNDLPHYELIPA